MCVLVAGTMESSNPKPIAISSSKAGLVQASDGTVHTAKDVAEDDEEHLETSVKSRDQLLPDFQHGTPSPESLAITNFSKATFATDTHSQARKTRKLLMNELSDGSWGRGVGTKISYGEELNNY